MVNKATKRVADTVKAEGRAIDKEENYRDGGRICVAEYFPKEDSLLRITVRLQRRSAVESGLDRKT